MTVENISWSISTKECCRPRWRLNPRPPGLESDSASNWAAEALRSDVTFCSVWSVSALFAIIIQINWSIINHPIKYYTIGIKHGFSCINICQVPWEVLKTEAKGLGFQHLPRDLVNVNTLKNHVRSLLLHKKWKHLLHFALFLALFCFAFSPMSRERNFHGLCSFLGWAVHISWRQQFCGPDTGILKVA